MRAIWITVAISILLLCGCHSEKDQADAQKAADRIHVLLKNQDFASIYRESSDDFKHEGDEAEFVSAMNAIHESAGLLKNTTPVAYQSSVNSAEGKQHILIYDLEFERVRGKERLVLISTGSGEMQLSDIVIEPVN